MEKADREIAELTKGKGGQVKEVRQKLREAYSMLASIIAADTASWHPKAESIGRYDKDDLEMGEREQRAKLDELRKQAAELPLARKSSTQFGRSWVG
jgi:hypothetical protein